MSNASFDSPTRSASPRFSWLFCAATLLAIAMGVGWHFIREWQATNRQQLCKSRLKQLGLALHAYHEEFGAFPPAYVLGPDERRWHSWRVLLLPFLGESKLHAEYRFDEPWDGAHNRELSRRMPVVFECPAGDAVGQGRANFMAVVGRKSAWPEYLSLRIRDYLDGTSNTLLLVESADSDINWLEPRDITVKQFLQWTSATAAPRCCSRHPGDPRRHVLLADGSVRMVLDRIHPEILGGILTPAMGGSSVAAQLPPTVGDVSESVFPDERPASELAATDVLPTTAVPVTAGRNAISCCTLRIMWDELRRSPDRQVHIPQPTPMALMLNDAPYPPGCLDPDTFLVQMENIEDIGKIHAAMARRFPGAKGPRTKPSGLPGFVVFAYLRKSLPFAAHFDSLKEPLRFPRGIDGQSVASFGRLPAAIPGDERLGQVQIHQYKSEDDFVIELLSTSHRDSMLLAKVPPRATFKETVDAVWQRSRDPRRRPTRGRLEEGELLIIPKLSFNVLREYPELVGLRLPDFDSRLGGAPGTTQNVSQGIAFVLNERGAELESFAEAGIIGSDGGDEPTPNPRQFVFDRPFLVLLGERAALEPYFALWLENVELMEAATPMSSSESPGGVGTSRR